MLARGPIRFLTAALAAMLAGQAAMAAERCGEREAQARDVAADINVEIEAGAVIAAGDPVTVRWSRDGRAFPQGTSAWLFVVTIDDVRFGGDGVIPLPGGTPGPLGVGFARKWTRAMVPLQTPDAPRAGRFEVKPFREGRFGLSWAVVAMSECGEWQLTETGTHRLEVEAQRYRIVVQDLYDYSRPRRVIRSRDGRYELRVFDGHYQVFDRKSGGKIVDRRGNCPDFSPTARFVAALGGAPGEPCHFFTAGKNKPKFEVVDLVSGELVAEPDPPALWAHGDALLVVPPKWWKMLQPPGHVISLLRDGPGGGLPVKLIELQDTDAVGLDIANGYLLRTQAGTDDPEAIQAVYGLATAGPVGASADGRADAEPHVEALTAEIRRRSGRRLAARPLAADAAVLPSHLRYIDDPEAVFGDIVDNVDALTARAVAHAEIAVESTPDVGDDPLLTASLLRGATPLSFDRTAGRSIEELVAERLDMPFTTQTPVKNPLDAVRAAITRIDGLPLTDDEKRARLGAVEAREVAPRVQQLLREMPEAETVITQMLGCWPSGGVPYGEHLAGLWRFEQAGRVAWLTQASCQGIGTVGNLALSQVDLFVRDDRGSRHYNLLFDRRFYCAGNGVNCEIVEADLETGLDISARETRYGRLAAAGDPAPGDTLGGKMSQDFHQLIEFDSLEPAMLGDRHLLLPVGRQMYVVDLARESLSGPLALAGNARGARFSLAQNRTHFMQVNADGAFAVHRLATGASVLQGRYVDDEIVIWDAQGRYTATPEGGRYVQMRFVGRPALYSLSQMAAVLEQPDAVRQALRAEAGSAAALDLAAPPRLGAAVADEPAQAGTVNVAVDARSATGLKALRIYRDGALIETLPLEGTAYDGRVAVPTAPETRWISVVAVDARGFESAPRSISLPAVDQAARGRLFVLAVGTDRYEDTRGLSQLGYAVADARRFTEAARQAAGSRYETVEIVGPLLDDATLPRTLDAALADLATRASAGDTVFVFFAGHGLRDAQGRFYLAGPATRVDALAETGLAWSQIADRLAAIRSRVFVFLDACHSGSASQATNDGAADALLEAGGSSITVIAASKGRQFSIESPAAGGGYYTQALAAVMAARGDPGIDRDGSGELELDELYLALKRRVVEATGGRQTPWIARSQSVGKAPLL
ncbi:hypothetical protein C7T96_06635 [Nitratireductor sp. StC3]|nr:hypothetical protein C7T96_06635 [Nitratireductor sp. StC3]